MLQVTVPNSDHSVDEVSVQGVCSDMWKGEGLAWHGCAWAGIATCRVGKRGRRLDVCDCHHTCPRFEREGMFSQCDWGNGEMTWL